MVLKLIIVGILIYIVYAIVVIRNGNKYDKENSNKVEESVVKKQSKNNELESREVT